MIYPPRARGFRRAVVGANRPQVGHPLAESILTIKRFHPGMSGLAITGIDNRRGPVARVPRAQPRLSVAVPGAIQPRSPSGPQLPRKPRIRVADSDMSLWSTTDPAAWQQALESYDAVIAQQGVAPLVELDRWYRTDLPAAIAGRAEPHVTHRELVRVTEWKMARGVWRARNLALVRGNHAAMVERTSREAISTIPDPGRPIALLAELAGVGPATASAVVAAVAPERYPFFDELVAAQMPLPGTLAFTQGYYARYAEVIRSRATDLGFLPAQIEQALWAHAGGKAGV